jgi:uncharacterized protein (TIGR02246 family)
MRSGIIVAAAVGLVGLASVVASGNRQPPAEGGADEAAVRKASKQFEEAFNRRDAKAMAALWAEGGELTDVDGTVVRGRAELEKMYAAAFAAAPKAKGQVEVDSVRPLGKNLVSVEGTLRFTRSEGQKPAVTKYSALFVREGEAWLTASVRESYPDTPAEEDQLADLAWLIGDWEGKRGDRDARTSYAWGDEKAFIVCKYRVTEGDKVVAAGMEVIAKDPESGQIRGWLFGRTGVLAESYWPRDGQQWVVDITGTLPDRTGVEATNAIVPNGPDAFSWVSVERSAEGQSLPLDPPLKVTRVKK